MSETDSFIEEVSEEVRRDKLFAMFRKYGWIGALVVIAIVSASAWYEWQRAEKTAAAERLGDAILTAVGLPNAGARAGALAELEAPTPAAAAALDLIEAAALMENKDPGAADAVLVGIASDPEAPRLYRDLAALKRIMLQDSGISAADRAATIESLARPGGAFRTLALEQRAIGMVASGDTDGALAIYRDLLQDAEATQALAQRARQMIVVLGGDLDAG